MKRRERTLVPKPQSRNGGKYQGKEEEATYILLPSTKRYRATTQKEVKRKRR